MKVLLLAATAPELANLSAGPADLEVLTTGLGSMTTAYHLGRRFANRAHLPELAVQAGVGGAVDQSLTLGGVYRIVSEVVADLGAEDRDGSTLSPADLGLDLAAPFADGGRLVPPSPTLLPAVPTATGGTVNRAHGSAESIARLRGRYPQVQIESMEGAAFFYACAAAGVPCVQLRAVSNYVTPRNRGAWRLEEAIENLHRVLADYLVALLKTPPPPAG